jgi:hypothetical protein
MNRTPLSVGEIFSRRICWEIELWQVVAILISTLLVGPFASQATLVPE